MFYIITKAIAIIKQVKLVRKKEFVADTFDPNNKTLVIHIISLISLDSYIHICCKANIVSLKTDDIFITILSKDTNFIDIFPLDLIIKLLGHTLFNNHTINLIDSK